MGEIYKGVIWTDHALQRLKEREIKIDDALLVLNSPQRSEKAKIKDAWVFIRQWGNFQLEIVAKENEKRQWVVLSVWPKYLNLPPEPWWRQLCRQIIG